MQVKVTQLLLNSMQVMPLIYCKHATLLQLDQCWINVLLANGRLVSHFGTNEIHSPRHTGIPHSVMLLLVNEQCPKTELCMRQGQTQLHKTEYSMSQGQTQLRLGTGHGALLMVDQYDTWAVAERKHSGIGSSQECNST